jgi:hypothetical protein
MPHAIFVNNGNRGTTLCCVQRKFYRSCIHSSLLPLAACISAEARRVGVTLTQGANVTLSSVDVDDLEDDEKTVHAQGVQR